jgi:uncharacterized paraquat-inducible protein A
MSTASTPPAPPTPSPETPPDPSADAPIALRQRCTAGALISVAFSFNLFVLLLPFMRLRQGLKVEPYTLFRSVELLWSGGLYVLAALVVAFSIIFPFAKLAVLGWVALAPTREGWQPRLFHLVERLGKWSMLDAFLVVIILALTSRQLFVGAEPAAGLALFIVAILLAMTAGEVLARGLAATAPPAPPASAQAERTGNGWWLALAGIALVATLTLPFLRIHDWRLVDRSYSIVSLVPILWIQGAWLAAVLTALFLVAAPLAVWVASAAVWWRRRSPSLAGAAASRDWIALAQRWSMLDVFGLALAVFALESEGLMRTAVSWGALALIGLLVLQRAFQRAHERSWL